MAMNQNDAQVLMKNLANDAVNFAESEFGTKLNFSDDSIAHIDEIIAELRNNFQSDIAQEKVIYTLSNIFGAYCGECFIKKHGGTWLIEDDGEKNLIYLQKDDATFPFPGVVYLNLVDNANLSISDYYNEASLKLKS